MPDDLLTIGSVTINLAFNQQGTDIVSVDLDEGVSVLQALGAIQVAQRDLLNCVATEEEQP